MKKNNYTGYSLTCQICRADNLKNILNLGHQPIVQEYLRAEELHESETRYPLNLVRCSNCSLVQIDYVPEPGKVFFPDYPYRTGLTSMLIRNFLELADVLEKKYELKPKDLIVDIGSNDGTLLKGFKAKGMQVLGIEPTNAAKDANKNGITTFQTFFDKASVTKAKKKYGSARVITATNVFAHINNVPELMRNVRDLLKSDGIFVSESQYLLDIVEKKEFDTVYHEHLRFYALKPLQILFNKYDMSLIDAERISAAGGSIRVYAKKGKQPMNARVKNLIQAEEQAGLYSLEKLIAWGKEIQKVRNDLLALLLKCKKNGAHIVGIGSPARANTLLGFSHITNELLDYAVEKKGSPKIGLYTPGTHIPVIDEEELYRDQPEYALILSWHIGEELIKIMKKNGYKGKYIMPLPKPRII
ncbi:MAG: hypothetical protein A2821_03120 [Candidatus Magasanikbacteria bacterium RIFCSPHIGHO2_01_FULL_41_23]|uniref:Methyltransferase n=1 Tax=Candidatus Magasanikbacteria bacterium RIFCSPLOWO2_01_FULL_40_15 TaxID=1798686 RepID=A0A1F6N435_9BACT|nr:MAG: hypothetical protein A2821_03120 [Candidatus Magasanikbacteria bacterium RIFCSPHIGHO2_01_FULL_41_23]OGH67329.1 MAG: hypothetical protein A3C66_01135 [Candidatus Magasanikbacteria bacterium RIFCSPHIGHO2_02_FULL_41_35]OGH76554.1 MAG: hypothetical protein A3F22_00345 [Candidatus Magasanikbacteria bacterium RIFCSPHIGHO2_12_FULL_41_16]OGH78460.1 MAG: hypothetical protein A2983_03010 [Candidatus Magasanikbacteria bacterium RIFCSPLOWO2_01_FULL_40_15]